MDDSLTKLYVDMTTEFVWNCPRCEKRHVESKRPRGYLHCSCAHVSTISEVVYGTTAQRINDLFKNVQKYMKLNKKIRKVVEELQKS